MSLLIILNLYITISKSKNPDKVIFQDNPVATGYSFEEFLKRSYVYINKYLSWDT